QHADVHRPAAAHDRHVGGNRTVDERPAMVDQRPLIGNRQETVQMKRAGRDFHAFTLPLAAVRRRRQEPRRTERSQSRLSLRILRALRSTVVIAAVLFVPRPAAAHPVPFSYVDLRLRPDAIEGSLVVHIFDAAHDLNVEPVERMLDPAVAAQHSTAFATLLAARFTVSADGRTLTPQWSAVEVLAERQSLKFTLRYPLAGTPGRLGVNAVMFPYDPQHQTFVNIYDGDALTQAILDRGRTGLEYFAGTRQGAFAVVQKFLPAG